MENFCPAAVLRTAVRNAYRNLVHDLNALTEEQAAQRVGDANRPALEIVAECASVNARFTAYLQTGQLLRPTPEARAAFLAGFTTREQALDILEKNTDLLLAAIDAFDPTRWGETVTGFESRFDTAFGVAEYAALHMMYHDGQLNFLHAFHGDTTMHWAA